MEERRRTSRAEARPQRETLGPYQLGLLLGKGGMGEVYKAFDNRLERWVAVKRLHSDAPAKARQRFRREARALAQLGHPAIVQIFDIVEDEEDDWIVMELVEGPTLTELRRQGPLDVGLVLNYGGQIASALEAAHARGIIHRDLKTENVMVPTSGRGASGRVKVLDFGLARHIASGSTAELVPEDPASAADPALTQPGLVLGTPRAMSPEQATARPVDERADLFSLGVLLYEILTARSPFVAEDVHETLRRVVHYHPPPARQLNPKVPEALSDFVDTLLAKDPRHRPPTAAAVEVELAAIVSASAVDPSTPSDRSRQSREGGAATLAPPSAAEKGRSVSDVPSSAGLTPVLRPVPAKAPGPAAASTSRRQLAERRQVTVLCCDLVTAARHDVGVTALDPETLSEVLPDLFDRAAALIARYEGTLADTFGHRLVAYFGFPAAHEDDANRAVRAGLELIESHRQTTPDQARPALRIGVHTGSAVVAAGEARRDPLILGSTFDETAAVQVLAAADEVVLSAATRRLTGAAFELEPVAGAGTATAGWRVVAAHEPQAEMGSMLEILPMVSRQRELELLLSRWQVAVEGRGQVVVVSGEAGIGKTRLIRAFRDCPPVRSHRWWNAYGSPFLQNSPLAPIAGLLRSEVLRYRRGEAVDVQLERLEAFLEGYALPRDEMADLFADLLELPAEGRYAAPDLSPDARRKRTLEALIALFLEMADEQPWVLAIEDLHWMDPSTLEFLGLVIERAASAPLYVLATSRPHGMPTWERGVALTQIHLDQLTAREGTELIERVAAGRPLIPALIKQILAKTDGVPLFIEELTKTILESDWDSDSFVIPATLRDSLTARLDRLGPAKEVAQTASIIGRGFTLELLTAVATTSESVLQRELDRLMDAALVYRKGFGSNTRYFFKHALIQDVAYDSLLRKDRQALHRRIAEVLVERFPATRDTQPEIVAHHFTEAGDAARAVPHWRQAGQLALAGSAPREALRHLERALELVEALPDRAKHVGEEVAILTSLGNCFLMNREFSTPQVERTWERAYALCEQLDSGPSLDVLFGLLQFHFIRGKFLQTPSIVEQMLQVVAAYDVPILHFQSRYYSGVNHFYIGRPQDALHDLERASAASSPEIGSMLVRTAALDYRVVVRHFEALALWLLGAPEQALVRSRQALELAREAAHPFTSSIGLFLVSILHLFRREGAAAESRAMSLLELSQQHGFYQERDGEVLAQCARITTVLESDEPAVANDTEDVIQQLTRGLEGHQESGTQVWSSLYTAHVVEACLARGETARAAVLLDQADESAAARSELFWQAELHRLRGDLELARDDADRARDAYLEAVAVARRQSARSLELRALVSLAEVDNSAATRADLAAAYGQFNEGFDTPDLRRAARLLDA